MLMSSSDADGKDWGSERKLKDYRRHHRSKRHHVIHVAALLSASILSRCSGLDVTFDALDTRAKMTTPNMSASSTSTPDSKNEATRVDPPQLKSTPAYLEHLSVFLSRSNIYIYIYAMPAAANSPGYT